MRKLPVPLTRRAMLVGLGCLVVTVFLAFALAGPVLGQTYLWADLFGSLSDPPLVLFNPLRNREPERVAEAMLRKIQAGNATEVLRGMCRNNEEYAHICERETQTPAIEWKNYTREDKGDQTVLCYWPTRQGSPGGYSPPIVIVASRVDGHYQATSYSATY